MNRLYLFELLRMQEFLEQNFRNNITAEDVARAGGYSLWHCLRIFQQYLGEPISRRLLRLRLEAGKEALRRGETVARAAASSGFLSREGFAKAFAACYGISPGRYARGEEGKERYREVYEFRMSAPEWERGQNPTEDGLWEFSYYDPKEKTEGRMVRWGDYFQAPYRVPDPEDPAWYCRNRHGGYGMHPGRGINAVRSFLCPKSGLLEYFISLGRISELHDGSNPCSVGLYHWDKSLFPPKVLSDKLPIFLQGVLRVNKGDRISLRLDAMGHMGRDGIMIYRQQMGYLEITDTDGESPF